MSANNYFYGLGIFVGIFIGIVLMGIVTFFICKYMKKTELHTEKMKELYPGYSREYKDMKLEPYYMEELNRKIFNMHMVYHVSYAQRLIKYCESLKEEYSSFLRKEDMNFLEEQIAEAKELMPNLRNN